MSSIIPDVSAVEREESLRLKLFIRVIIELMLFLGMIVVIIAVTPTSALLSFYYPDNTNHTLENNLIISLPVNDKQVSIINTESITTTASSKIQTEPSPTPATHEDDVISRFINLIQTKPIIPLSFILVILVTALTLILFTAQRKYKVTSSPQMEENVTAPLLPKPVLVKDDAFLQLKCQPELTFPLALDDIRIGRAPDNTIVIPSDVPNVETVSIYHARLYRFDRWILEDLDSTNGTYVNGKRTGRNYLRDGWEIGIGGVIFIFHTGKVEI